MCKCESEGRRCTIAGLFRSMFVRPPAAAAAAAPRPSPYCARCGVVLESEDVDALHKGWCYDCDAYWFEEEICKPLVRRLGKAGAIRAFRKLVANVKSLT